jgi:hypothetical protein
MKKLAVLIVALGVMLIPVAALAAAPLVLVDEDYGYVVDVDLCGTGNVSIVVSGHERHTMFFNKAGEPTRVAHHDRGTATFTHDDGSTAFDRWAFTFVYDIATDDATFNGSSYNVHASGGGGILFTDSGKLVYSSGGDVVHGPHDSYGVDPEPVVDAAICDAWAS